MNIWFKILPSFYKWPILFFNKQLIILIILLGSEKICQKDVAFLMLLGSVSLIKKLVELPEISTVLKCHPFILLWYTSFFRVCLPNYKIKFFYGCLTISFPYYKIIRRAFSCQTPLFLFFISTLSNMLLALIVYTFSLKVFLFEITLQYC